MTVSQGHVWFETEHGVVFNAPLSAVLVEFTTYSTLVFHVAGARHVFVAPGYAGVFARPFSPAPVAALAEASHADAAGVRDAQAHFGKAAGIMISGSVMRDVSKVVGGMAGIAGFGLGAVGGVIGVVEMYKAQSQAFAMSKLWAQYLEVNGVQVHW